MNFFSKLKNKFLNQGSVKTLTVEGMKCAHCKATMEKTAQNFPNITWAEVDLDKGELHYTESEPIDLTKLKQALRDVGFNPL